MSFDYYKTLSPDDQELVMWYSGVPVAGRIGTAYRYLLFQVEAFYIELVYKMDNNIIHEMNAFDDMDRLEPYLPKVKITFTKG